LGQNFGRHKFKDYCEVEIIVTLWQIKQDKYLSTANSMPRPTIQQMLQLWRELREKELGKQCN
jgi:hypothetical protein